MKTTGVEGKRLTQWWWVLANSTILKIMPITMWLLEAGGHVGMGWVLAWLHEPLENHMSTGYASRGFWRLQRLWKNIFQSCFKNESLRQSGAVSGRLQLSVNRKCIIVDLGKHWALWAIALVPKAHASWIMVQSGLLHWQWWHYGWNQGLGLHFRTNCCYLACLRVGEDKELGFLFRCVCLCVCVRKRGRGKKRNWDRDQQNQIFEFFTKKFIITGLGQ